MPLQTNVFEWVGRIMYKFSDSKRRLMFEWAIGLIMYEFNKHDRPGYIFITLRLQIMLQLGFLILFGLDTSLVSDI